jgi:hypothetical protein
MVSLNYPSTNFVSSGLGWRENRVHEKMGYLCLIRTDPLVEAL